MAVSLEFSDFISELLEPFGDFTIKRMFGGIGIYWDGIMMAVLFSDELYFKTGPSNIKDYQDKEMPAFKPFENKPMTMSYSLVPPEVIEDREAMELWATKALEAALAAKKKKSAKKI
ncbi:MAG: TfoX/Sxy family protein [SAR324 cluster bacterium]|nr:TfoX/Sxy family protein [SAR324 cluster bacterium]